MDPSLPVASSVSAQPIQSTSKNWFQRLNEWPGILNEIAIIFFVLALFDEFYVLQNLVAIFLLEKSDSLYGIRWYIFKYFPTYPLAIVLASFIPLINIYVGLKIRSSSKFSFWLGLLFALIQTSIYMFLLLLISPWANNANPGQQVTFFSILWGTFSFENLFKPGTVCILLAVGMLIFYRKKFTLAGQRLSKRARIILFGIAVLTILPTILLFGYGFAMSQDNDHNYTHAQKAVAYHIYKPRYLPYHFENFSNFQENKFLEQKSGSTFVMYEPPQFFYNDSIGPQAIFVKEVGVEPNFDLDSIAHNFATQKNGSLDVVSLTVAKNQQVYLIKYDYQKSRFSQLWFLTPDNVLIEMTSYGISEDDYFKVANSLK